MTQFNDLVNRAWMHARIGTVYLAGLGPGGATLDPEPTAYTEQFIARAEAVTGCIFERVLLSERDQLVHEQGAVRRAYQAVEARNFWTDDDRRHWRDLCMRYTDLRKAIQAMDAEEAGV